ncbi:asparagine synthase-related protein [Methanobacterium petrolearium]|uniref:asparagine synthase-related protein n=1 Tax=Methanobacterium petrolearium TaxID=710190 RepID=UPI003081E961
MHNQEPVALPPRLSWKEDLSRNESKEFENTPRTLNKDYIKNILKDLILKSVQRRIRGLDRVGMLFSGGVDSTLLTVLCADLGVETELYAVGSEGSPDLNCAEKVAEYMHLPIHIKIVDEEVVREYTPL